MSDLHGIFAYTIFGDKIRVSHYGDWNAIQTRWQLVENMRLDGDWSLVKYFLVRSWDDPGWNLSRYRSLDTLQRECDEYSSPGFTVTVRDFNERKIACIKHIRQVTRLGLREAKEASEGIRTLSLSKDQLTELDRLFEQDGMILSFTRERS